MKTLIIHGSPRRNGDSSTLANILKASLNGDVIELHTHSAKLSPCIDCRYCSKIPACSISDDMALIYNDDFDRVVIASPVHTSTLPGPLVSLSSRFQVYFCAKLFLGKNIDIKPKQAAIILTGGGKGRPDEALRLSKFMLKQMGGTSGDIQIITSLNTDELPAAEDAAAVQQLRELAAQWNSLPANKK